ncbi:Uncharacterized protein OBRU01_11215 [Operophtera brumata]|uniref:Uncharacterized protein n=1 Tax=Operophtera brumata TaxID=104452 RepID=A0A0L7L353_OPEBR|nr:Uncharacterized protein OBRU01_11215 [Operophtera brumata]
MMFERSYQSQIIRDDLHLSPKRDRYLKPKTTSLRQTLKIQSKKYFKLFLETSSIHGLNHLVAYGRHPFEILLWLTVVGLSVFGAVYLSQTTWMRYQSSPTVVSMDRDMYAWNTTFPCVTVCPDNYLDAKKLELYVQNSQEPDKKKLEKFIIALANASYETFNEIPDYTSIAPEHYMELILNLSAVFKPSLTIGVSGIMLNIVPTITEMGLCYAVNSRIYYVVIRRYRDANRWDVIKTHNRTLYIHPLDGEVFAQVYIHGPLEFPDISTKYQHSAKDYYMKLYVTAITVYTAPEAAKLSIGQRRCRFPHENNLLHNSIYTYTLCRMECRIRLCLKYCKCAAGMVSRNQPPMGHDNLSQDERSKRPIFR